MHAIFVLNNNKLPVVYIDVWFMYIISPAHIVPRGHGRLMFHLSHYVQTVLDVHIVYSLFKLKHHPLVDNDDDDQCIPD
jgi:hypothetical protein